MSRYSAGMTLPKIERIFRLAVQEAIAEKHAAGMPAYQGIDGYLVAIYLGGRKVRLKKLTTEFTAPVKNDRPSANNTRRS